MSFSYKNYNLCDYLQDPWYPTEIALFQAILDKLPNADKTYVGAEHYHSKIASPTAGTSVLEANDSLQIVVPQLANGVAIVDTNIMGVTGSVNGYITAGVDAAIIGAGTVSNTEYGYLNGVTGPIQAQIDAISAGAGITGLASNQVTYSVSSHPTFSSVKDALDHLLYVPSSISSLTNTAGTKYKGDTVTGFVANWAISGDITAQTLTGKTPALGDRTATYTGLSLTADTSYTLTIDDAVSSPVDTAVTTIYFRLRKYHGTSSLAAPDEATIEAATATASINSATSRSMTSTSVTGGGNYPFYAYPAAWGNVSLTVNGFATVWNVTTVSITSAEGNTENYTVYTSPNQVVGAITLVATAA
jgi:hypothetical protein